MRERPRKLTLLAATTVLALSACSTTTSEPAAGSTVQLQADYPSYDTRSLIKEATLIVEGTVLATERPVSDEVLGGLQGDAGISDVRRIRG